jgi:hypothetical protein
MIELQTELLPLLDVCKGTLEDGVCSTDPVKGKFSKVSPFACLRLQLGDL